MNLSSDSRLLYVGMYSLNTSMASLAVAFQLLPRVRISMYRKRLRVWATCTGSDCCFAIWPNALLFLSMFHSVDCVVPNSINDDTGSMLGCMSIFTNQPCNLINLRKLSISSNLTHLRHRCVCVLRVYTVGLACVCMYRGWSVSC